MKAWVKDRVIVLGRSLPAPLKALVKRALSAADPIVVRVAGARLSYREPIPPISLRARVGTPFIGDFMRGGPTRLDGLELACRQHERSLSEAESLLDFGCGCGRLLLAMRRSPLLSGCRLVGSDVDAEAIGWLKQAYPDLGLAVNSFTPPLPFEDDEFDVVVSYSVFTHLDESLQFAWLRELRRVLAPDGLALLTVSAPGTYERFRSGDMIANSRECAERMASHGSLDREGFIFELFDRNPWNEGVFSGIDGDYGLTFHSRDYIERSWSSVLDVQGIVAPPQMNGWQDVVVATPAAQGPRPRLG